MAIAARAVISGKKPAPGQLSCDSQPSAFKEKSAGKVVFCLNYRLAALFAVPSHLSSPPRTSVFYTNKCFSFRRVNLYQIDTAGINAAVSTSNTSMQGPAAPYPMPIIKAAGRGLISKGCADRV